MATKKLNDQTTPHTTEVFYQVRCKTTFWDQTQPPQWHRAGDFDTEAEARAYIARQRAAAKQLQVFMDQGQSEWIIQQRRHTVLKVTRVK